MMIGETTHGGTAFHVPKWSFAADNPSSFSSSPNRSTASYASVADYSPFFQSDSFTASPPNTNDAVAEFQLPDSDNNGCDHFRMFEYKVRMCPRGRSHDWTDCPFAHPGEKARRRDPRKFRYSGTACPSFRRGSCRQGDACEFAHGVFECWLHPARYRTLPCKDGANCKRRVCFFAHSPHQLRVLSPAGAESHDGSPHRIASRTESPPMIADSVGEMVASLRQLQLSMPSSWAGRGSTPMTLPGTPTRAVSKMGMGYFDEAELWEEPVMERVESGRDLRARMFEKLSKDNPLDRVDPGNNPNPDAGWVSELVK